MSGTETRNLLLEPRWRAAELGAPMPDSTHAASACLPLWEHNIRYEEGDPQVVDRLRAAYPRFCLHPLVRQLCRQVFGAEGAGLIFPTVRCAERAAAHVRSRGGEVLGLIPVAGTGATGVQVPADDFGRLKEYWQHAGEIVSSRAAEILLSGSAAAVTETESRRVVRGRFARYGGGGAGAAWLFPSGMAAIACVWRAIRRLDPQHPTVQFGFPYVDTLKIQQRFQPQAWHFLPRGDAGDLEQLSRLLQSQPISALFCETPTNPLLTMPDLAALRRLADEHGFLLIVDDTLAAVINDNPLPWADAVATSLTKYFSGQGDVLA
ncbi:MAG: PLP-dependent transferase, partial [Planctomycetaceae bacterium]